MARFALILAFVASFCLSLGMSMKAHGLGIVAASNHAVASQPFLVKHHDDETSDPELDTPTYHPTHAPTHHSKTPVLAPTEIPSSRPSSIPVGPSSNAELVGFVSFAFFLVLLYVLYQYYFRKVQVPPPSEEGIDMTSIDRSSADTNTAYGSTYHKVKGSDNA